MTLNLFGKDFPAPNGDVEVSDKPSVLPEQLVKILHDLRFTPLESYSPIIEQLSKTYSQRLFTLEELLPKNIQVLELTGVRKEEIGNPVNEFIKANSKKDPICFVIKDSSITTIVINSDYGLISHEITLMDGYIRDYKIVDKTGENKRNKNVATLISLELLFLPETNNGEGKVGKPFKFYHSSFSIKFNDSTYSEAMGIHDGVNFSGMLSVISTDKKKRYWMKPFKDVANPRLDQTGIMTIGEVCFNLFGNSAQYEKTKEAAKFFFRD